MSAVLNDNERMVSVEAFSVLRAINHLDGWETRKVLAAAFGALSDREGLDIALQVVGRATREVRAGQGTMGLMEIAFSVAKKHGLSIDDLRAPDSVPGARTRPQSRPRQEAFWLARRQRRSDGTPRHSTTQIGRFFGGRDHTTVIYGADAHEKRLLALPAD